MKRADVAQLQDPNAFFLSVTFFYKNSRDVETEWPFREHRASQVPLYVPPHVCRYQNRQVTIRRDLGEEDAGFDDVRSYPEMTSGHFRSSGKNFVVSLCTYTSNVGGFVKISIK